MSRPAWLIFMLWVLLFTGIVYLLGGCALGRAWDEADYRARYAPIAKEVVKP